MATELNSVTSITYVAILLWPQQPKLKEETNCHSLISGAPLIKSIER